MWITDNVAAATCIDVQTIDFYMRYSVWKNLEYFHLSPNMLDRIFFCCK